MKQITLISLLVFLSIGVSAQFVNNGATVTIKSGAILYVDNDIENNNSGIINNEGTIELTGDFANAAKLNSSINSLLRFSGNAASLLTSNGDTLELLDIAKTSEKVTLQDILHVNDSVRFQNTAGLLNLGAVDLNMLGSAGISGYDMDDYIQADGVGMLVLPITANSILTFPVGDNSNYSPLDADVSGTGYTNATVKANVESMDHPNLPADATDYLNRFWNIDQSGITDYGASLTGTYDAGDVVGDETKIKGSTYVTDWSYINSGNDDVANQVSGDISASSEDFTGTNFYGKFNISMFLEGNYSSGSGEMSTSLNSGGILEAEALTSPYTDAPATVSSGFFAANPDIVDWIKVTVMDGSTELSKHSFFVDKNGDMIDTSGNAGIVIKDAPQICDIAVFHRNHLTIMTPSQLNLTATGIATHDFTTGLAQAWDDVSNTINDAMVDLGSGIFGCWRGNVNSDTNVNVIDLLGAKIAITPNQAGVYEDGDLNMDGNANVIDLLTAKVASTPNKSAHIQ